MAFAFEVAAYAQGAHVTYLDPTGSQIGHKESMKDTARVLGRMYDGIEYRGSRQELVETLATHSGVPVWNGLTDEWHPTQSLCDVLTMREHVDPGEVRIAVAYLGDARNNVGCSLLVGGVAWATVTALRVGVGVQPVAHWMVRARPSAMQSPLAASQKGRAARRTASRTVSAMGATPRLTTVDTVTPTHTTLAKYSAW